MKLDEEEQAMLHGDLGPPRKWAMEHMIKVGQFFDANDFVSISQAHMMADTESLGEAGVKFFEKLASFERLQRRVKVPIITDPRGIDFKYYRKLKQTDAMAELEKRAILAFEALGILMTDTCINYQTIMPPLKGEHVAYGDTGVVIYCNSVIGALSNFEGGPSALAAGLTGRVPRYGLHLNSNRKATCHYVIERQFSGLLDWGALGAIIGQKAGSYWQVPVVSGIKYSPKSDELKHFGAAMASYGSTPLFHLAGITPEAPTLDSVYDLDNNPPQFIANSDFDAYLSRHCAVGEKIDVVVFSAPQLSIFEMRELADLLLDKKIHNDTALLAVTSPQVAYDAERFGITSSIEASGALVLQGMCFYQSYAREMGRENGWTTLMTNSTKLTNIISGYGYKPFLGSMSACVKSAVAGELVVDDNS